MPNYNFSTHWDELPKRTANAFKRKCEYIEKRTLELIAAKYHLDYELISKEVTPIDPESEWESLDGRKELPNDMSWIDFEIQFFEEELAEKDII